MPIFEYECRKCGNIFEVLCSSSSSKKVKCPACASGRVQKLLSSFSVSSGRGETSSSTASSACSTCSTHNCSSCR